MISAEDDEVLHQIADEDDDVDHDEDLEPTPEFLDPTTQRTLESADKLLAEFELTLSALSAEDEFDTALIVDSADDVERLFRNNQELAKKFTWPRLMQTAIEHGMAPRVLKLCIDRGAKVNAVDAERQMATPLVACIRNRTLPHMWQLLLDNGADPNKGDAELSVLQHAILAGKLDMMWALKTAGVDIDLVDSKGRGTPLRFAIAMRAIDSALELIDMGADCTYALHGQSLLHFVTQPPSFDREAELVRALVLKGASINARDGLGRTPLLCAVHENRQPLVAVFLELGANIGAVDDRGANALLILVKSSTAVFNVELAEMLLTKGCSAVQKPTKGTWTAVGWIEKMLRDRIGDVTPYQELATMLFRHGVTLNLSSTETVGV